MTSPKKFSLVPKRQFWQDCGPKICKPIIAQMCSKYFFQTLENDRAQSVEKSHSSQISQKIVIWAKWAIWFMTPKYASLYLRILRKDFFRTLGNDSAQ